MERWLPANVRLRVAGAFQELEREGRHVYRIDAAGRRHVEVDWTSDRNRPLIAAVQQAQEAAEAAFLDMLRRGRLVAWGRAGGPLAPLRRVPADAWAVLRLTNVSAGRAAGPGVALFGLRVAPAEPAPEAAAEPAGGEPPAPVPAPEAGQSSVPAPDPAGAERGAPAPDPAGAAAAWMRSYVTERGHVKREVAIRDCVAALGVAYRTARAAWDALPAELRRPRGRPTPPK
jgi:hypothetical protein